MEINEYRQLKAFAIQDGTLLGVLWISCFACFIIQLSNPSMSIVWMALSIFSVGFAFIRVRKFGLKVREGNLTFGSAWMYSMTMFVCACLLMAIANYVYFAYIDKGFLVGKYLTIFDSDEAKLAMKAYGIDKKLFEEAVQTMVEKTPIGWALEILTSNMMLGIILSPLVALYAKQKNKLKK